jgi:hypothetical protein
MVEAMENQPIALHLSAHLCRNPVVIAPGCVNGEAGRPAPTTQSVA